jgi:pimeloyl-ACP methyl ester carboxylesterase
MDQVEVEGLSIAYRRAGTESSLVLLHGFFGDSRSWRPQLEQLSDGFDVVAWDAIQCFSPRIN